MEIISMINIKFLITSEPNCDKEIKETKNFKDLEKIYIYITHVPFGKMSKKSIKIKVFKIYI
jgi:3-hydroxy-3-methylglutaryl CoA synthase